MGVNFAGKSKDFDASHNPCVQVLVLKRIVCIVIDFSRDTLWNVLDGLVDTQHEFCCRQ